MTGHMILFFYTQFDALSIGTADVCSDSADLSSTLTLSPLLGTKKVSHLL